MMLANITVPLVGAVDTALMGRLNDPVLIGGVAVGAQIFSLFYWMFGFLRTGTTGFAAQAGGAGDKVEIRATLLRPMLVGAVIAVLLMTAQEPLLRLNLWIVSPDADVSAAAGEYFYVRIWDAPATFFSYAALGWLLAMKRADAVFVATVVVNLANILLSAWFVYGEGWGIAGVAFGTVLAQYLGLAVTFLYLRQELRRHGAIALKGALQDKTKWLRVLVVNRDIFLRTLCLELVFTLFLAFSARLGPIGLAANAILLHLQAMMAYALDGFAHAGEVLCGWALGAKRKGDMKAAVRACALWAMSFSVPIALLYLVLGGELLAVFTREPAVLAAADGLLLWVALSPVVSVWSFLYDGIYFGATQSREMRNAMLLAFSVFALAGHFFTNLWGAHGLWLAFTLFMATRGLALHLYYPRILRRFDEVAPLARLAATP